MTALGLLLSFAVMHASPSAAPLVLTTGYRQTQFFNDGSTPILPVSLVAVVNQPAFQSATLGILAVRLKDNEVLIRTGEQRACMPASNQKLYTAAAALHILGPDFTWKTELAFRDGVLYLTFDGDPLLTRSKLKEAIRSLQTSIKEPIQRIQIDDSHILGDAFGVAWQWDDIGLRFSAPIGAATIDSNTLHVTVKPPSSRTGQPTIVVEDGLLSLVGRVDITDVVESKTTKQATAGVIIKRNPLKPEVSVTGTVRIGNELTTALVAVDNPTGAAFRRVQRILTELGISVSPDIKMQTGERPNDLPPGVLLSSQPLSETLSGFLKASDNLYGELLLRTLGRRQTMLGTPEAGINAVLQWCTDNLISANGLQPADGSGLSMWNTVTALGTVQLLRLMADNSIFKNALPVGGVDGTLKSRFPEPDLKNRVFAKTGTLSVASALSGYVTDNNGETIVFSILMNHFDRKIGSSVARKAQDDIVRFLASSGKPQYSN